MFDLDSYLSKEFHIRDYNCWHFARDVWKDITGDTLYDFTPPDPNKAELEAAATDAIKKFVEVHSTCYMEPLLVLMQRPKDAPHIGVLYKLKVLHLRSTGALYQNIEVATDGWPTVRFYTTSPR